MIRLTGRRLGDLLRRVGVAMAMRLAVILITSLVIAVGVTPSSALGHQFCDGDEAREAYETSAGHPNVPTGRGKVSLVVKSRHLKPGQTVYARLVNFSPENASYGLAFRIERFSGSGWEMDSSSPDGPWPKSRGRLSPGFAGKCFRFQIPAGQPRGRYRLSARVQLSVGDRRRSGEFFVDG
jgi:hypothetical protein